jgi:hypothetical protein
MAPEAGSGSTLRPCRRFITTHDASGKSVYAESPDQSYFLNKEGGGLARSFALEGIPVDFTNEADIKNYRSDDSTASVKKSDIVVPGGGAHLVTFDLGPGAESAFHRTESIDFSICVIGEIEHELDSGEKVTLLPGVGFVASLSQIKLWLTRQDHIVQRGTMHKWINKSKTEPARAVAVTLPAAAFEIPGTGKMLQQEWLPKSKI